MTEARLKPVTVSAMLPTLRVTMTPFIPDKAEQHGKHLREISLLNTLVL